MPPYIEHILSHQASKLNSLFSHPTIGLLKNLFGWQNNWMREFAVVCTILTQRRLFFCQFWGNVIVCDITSLLKTEIYETEKSFIQNFLIMGFLWTSFSGDEGGDK